jgi:hypothetical protein
MASLRNEGVPGGGRVSNNWSVSQKEQFRVQLAKVLESSHFRSSKRCTLFLRCVGEHLIENRLDSLKERTLGIEVFERAPAYDTNQDPIVRSTAVEVRKRLAQYYLDPGHETEPRISLPAGSYVAEIHPPPGTARSSFLWPRFSKKVWLVAACAIVLSAAAAFAVLSFRNTNLNRFWEPFISSAGPITICLGQPHTYVFVAPQQGRIRAWFEKHPADGTPPPELASIPLQQIVPTWGRHIDISDAQAYERLAALFTQKGRAVQLRGDLSVALSELRGHPTVLIGAFNNDWTLGLGGELRFHFQADSQNQVELVRDRQNPNRNEWRVTNAWPYRNIPMDYAIVTRVTNPTTEQTVVIAAGITHIGTRAAVELVTNEAYFVGALRGAPAGWQHKNMQVVLSTKVMSGGSGPPQVLDRYFW